LKKIKPSEISELTSLDNLEISLIRKVYKPYLIPYIEERMPNEKYNMKSDFEIKIIFEFDEVVYNKIYESFSFIQAVKKLGHKKFKPDISLDKGAVGELARNCSSDLFLGLISKNKILDYFNEENLKIKVEILNSSVYVRGTYMKFSRDIGQSPWTVNGVKICESSVQDEMRDTLKQIFKCDDCVMSAGGREDRDVRMLGSGRPFIMEIVNPKLKTIPLQDIGEIEKNINCNTKLIKVKNLSICDKSYYAVLKKYEDSKQKFYTCLVCTEKVISNEELEKLNQITDLNVVQKTPIRVMHRRTLMDRNKQIFKIDAERINENFLIVNVLASAGTYIKEFIHSDLGRTSPSLVELLDCDCDILQLDVLDIIYEN
jgi:hypothetical protein